MSKKNSYNYIKTKFAEAGCVLLSKTYKNNEQKLHYICSCGNKAQIRYGSFSRGSRCQRCAGNEKLSYKFVKKEFEKAGCKLLAINYKNSKTKMSYICSCGNQSETKWDNFRQGKKCSKCSGNERFSYQKVKESFEKAGCILLSTEYKNANSSLDYICSCGRTSKISYECFKSGQRCRECGNRKTSAKLKGKNNPRWRHDVSMEERIIDRNYWEYSQWRKAVYERDNYICQVCEKKSGNGVAVVFNAHHIESYHNNKHLRTELQNGITLCIECHDLFHNIYGQKNNNRDQFKSYLLRKSAHVCSA